MHAYVNNDNLVEFLDGGTTVMATGDFVTLGLSATVTFRVQTLDGVDVLGETWPVQLTYITNSAGHYIGVLRNEVALLPDTEYRLLFTVDNGQNQHAEWVEPLWAIRREG